MIYFNTITLFLKYFLCPRKNSVVNTPTISLPQAPHPQPHPTPGGTYKCSLLGSFSFFLPTTSEGKRWAQLHPLNLKALF